MCLSAGTAEKNSADEKADRVTSGVYGGRMAGIRVGGGQNEQKRGDLEL